MTMLHVEHIKFTCPSCQKVAEANAFIEPYGHTTTCPHCRVFGTIEEKDLIK